jgi:ATP-binding cassette subfamily C exporter for protease/lipase
MLKTNPLHQELKHFSKGFLWIIILSIMVNILTLSPTLYMLQLYDRVLISQNDLTLLFVSLIILIFFIVMAISEWLRSELFIILGLKLDETLNRKIFRVMFDQYLKDRDSKSLQGMNDLTNLRQFLTGNGVIAFLDLPWTPIYIGLIFILNSSIGFLAIFFCALQLALSFLNQSKRKTITSNFIEADKTYKNYLFSRLRNSDAFVSMGMLKNFKLTWLNLYRSFKEKQMLYNNDMNRHKSTLKFARYCMQSFTLGAAALFVVKGDISAGSMIACNILMGRVLQPIDIVVGSWKDFEQAKSAYGRLKKSLQNTTYKIQPKKISDALKEIKIDRLNATVPQSKQVILNNINLTFKSGEITAVVGPSGSGKTTLSRCVLDLWLNYTGNITIDKINIKDWDKAKLGDLVGYLPQDIELFEGSVAENIARFGELQSEKIIEATQIVGIHESILKLPQGYDTLIGESHFALSGGQKQRIALARAIFNNPKLIVLDEPDSNLDEAGDRALIDTLKKMQSQGAIILLITHRQSMLHIANRIFHIKEGEVEEKIAVLKELPH